jgi:diguanylate cyclase
LARNRIQPEHAGTSRRLNLYGRTLNGARAGRLCDDIGLDGFRNRGRGMIEALSEREREYRLERRLKTRVFDTYERSSMGGFLYLFAWFPLLHYTGLLARYPTATLITTAALLVVAIVRKLTRPPSAGVVELRRWVYRYVLVALSSMAIWAGIQIQVLIDPEIAPLLKCASLFGTIALASVLAHLYSSMMRLVVVGSIVLIVPALVALWSDPQMQGPAAALTLYAGYLVSAILRSRSDYMRRLELDEALRDQRDQYENLSRIDSLTSLCNRRTFTETLNARVREAQMLGGAGVALALLDVDHFKSINDRHGHVIGDEVLKHLARRLESSFANEDVMVARTGGEEFGLILSNADEISAMIRVESFRESLEATPIVCAGLLLPVRVSIGVGSFHADRHRDDDGLYGAVDVALYAAKQQGRNRVVSVSMLSLEAASACASETERLR